MFLLLGGKAVTVRQSFEKVADGWTNCRICNTLQLVELSSPHARTRHIVEHESTNAFLRIRKLAVLRTAYSAGAAGHVHGVSLQAKACATSVSSHVLSPTTSVLSTAPTIRRYVECLSLLTA